MFKRMVCIMLCLLLLLAVPVKAAEQRDSASAPTLQFDGTTASCSFRMTKFGAKIEVTLELRCNGTLVASWPASGTTTVRINEQYTAVKGATYTLVAKGTCDGVAFTSSTVTGTCP